MISTILLTLFAISLILMVAGSFLSFRAQRRSSSSAHEGSSAYSGGTLRGGARIYSSSVNTLTKSPATLRSAATLTRKPARLKAPAAGYRYEIYREETFVSRMLPHLNIMQLIKPRVGQPTPWLGVIVVCIALFGFFFTALQPVLNHSSVGILFTPFIPDTAPAPSQSTTARTTKQSPFAGVAGVSQSLLRVNQMSTSQYTSSDDYNTWAASACSAAAMTEVINAYSHKNYRVGDILKVESGLHQITPEDGLLQPQGIGITVAKFGFNATYLQNPTLSSIEQIANAGHPVIVSFPPSNWPGGHILILRGGNNNQVYLADSSVLNMQVMASDKFLSYWGGFAVVVTPNK